jgi:hypothetical protein
MLCCPRVSTASCIHVYDLAVKQRIVRPVLQLPVADAVAASQGGVNVLLFNEQVGWFDGIGKHGGGVSACM